MSRNNDTEVHYKTVYIVMKESSVDYCPDSYTEVEGFYWTEKEAKAAARISMGFPAKPSQESDDEDEEDEDENDEDSEIEEGSEYNSGGEWELEEEDGGGGKSRVWIAENVISNPFKISKAPETKNKKGNTTTEPPTYLPALPPWVADNAPATLATPVPSNPRQTVPLNTISSGPIPESSTTTAPPIPSQPEPEPEAPPESIYIVLETETTLTMRRAREKQINETKLSKNIGYVSLPEANKIARGIMNKIRIKDGNTPYNDEEDYDFNNDLYDEEYAHPLYDYEVSKSVEVKELKLAYPKPPPKSKSRSTVNKSPKRPNQQSDNTQIGGATQPQKRQKKGNNQSKNTELIDLTQI